jgi:hypothetical protein
MTDRHSPLDTIDDAARESNVYRVFVDHRAASITV